LKAIRKLKQKSEIKIINPKNHWKIIKLVKTKQVLSLNLKDLTYDSLTLRINFK